MVEQKWTAKMVVDRLEEAASTLRRLPRVSPKGFSSSWPTIVQEFMEAYGESEVHLRLGPPPGEAITRMDECLEWMRWLEADQARLVWWRAVKTPWKNITAKMGQDRTTVWRRWNLAISWIAARLDARDEKKCCNKKCPQHLQQKMA